MSDSGFRDMINSVKNNICKNGVYSPYVSFTIHDTIFNDVTFTTNDSDRCMIVSFENNKNGSGQANTFSITLSFSPSSSLFYKSNSLDYSDISLIDKILHLNKDGGLDENGEVKSPERKCTIQYGYSYPTFLLSKPYTGRILDYTTEVSNGILIYTITGYSGLAVESRDMIVTVEGSVEGEEKEKKKPTQIVREIYEKYMKDISQYKLEFDSDTEGTDQEIEIESAQDVPAFQYMKSILECAMYSEDTEETKPEERCTYNLLISDVKGEEKIIVSRYDPKEKQAKVNDENVVRFSWMGSGETSTGSKIYDYHSDAMVIDFKTDFKGSVSMAYNYSKVTNYVKRKGINSAGEQVDATGTTIPSAGSNTKNDNVANLNLWATRLQYMYTANMTLIGIPYEIKLLENIYVAPLLYGQEHHTGGFYKITKITDVIDSNGFITTLELSRNMAPDHIKQRQELLQGRLDAFKNSSGNYAINSQSDYEMYSEIREKAKIFEELTGERVD